MWKSISGFEGIYEVSDSGQVKSVSRIDIRGNKMAEKIMKTAIDKSGYEMVNLRRGSLMKRIKVHRLVAGAFIPNVDMKPAVNHIDGNKTNNRAENLEWATNKENQYHSTHSLGNKPKGRLSISFTDKRNSEIMEFLRDRQCQPSQTFLVNKFSIGYVTAKKLLNQIHT